MICPNCEMYYPATMLDGSTVVHECPEPYDYTTAISFCQFAQSAGGIVVHPRVKARVVLGLKQGPPKS